MNGNLTRLKVNIPVLVGCEVGHELHRIETAAFSAITGAKSPFAPTPQPSFSATC